MFRYVRSRASTTDLLPALTQPWDPRVDPRPACPRNVSVSAHGDCLFIHCVCWATTRNVSSWGKVNGGSRDYKVAAKRNPIAANESAAGYLRARFWVSHPPRQQAGHHTRRDPEPGETSGIGRLLGSAMSASESESGDYKPRHTLANTIENSAASFAEIVHLTCQSGPISRPCQISCSARAASGPQGQRMLRRPLEGYRLLSERHPSQGLAGRKKRQMLNHTSK
jgi:hypothetical protein